MSEDVSAGRLHIDAYADTSGFARDAKAKVDAATKNLRAKIKVELDDRGVIAQAKASAAKAQKAAAVRLKATLDDRGMIQQAKTAAAKASKAAQVKIGAKIDERAFKADLARAVAELDRKYTVRVNVDVDTAGAAAKVAAFRAAQATNPINIGLNLGGGGGASQLGSIVSSLSKFPMLAGGVFALGSALAQLTGGLFAVASAASQAVTTVAALPNLLGIVGQGVAVLLAGFSGIGDAVGALGEADKASAGQTATAASTRADSARRVADAQQALGNAYRAAADAARDARFAIQDAEWNLARAHEAAAEAQENLNEARRQARENLDELNDSLERAALSEETAANNLQKAKQALQDVLWDNSASAQEQRDAELAVKQAQQDLKDARDDHNDLAKETAEANEAGVRGSEEVEEARDALRDANHNVMLSERALMLARDQAADTARANAQMIADAQQAVRDAQMAGTGAIAAQSAAISDQMDAFNKLTPAAQRFARFLFETVMPRFGELRDNIQEAILPPIQEGITRAMPFIDTLETGLLGTADVVGKLAIDLGDLLSDKTFNDDVAKVMDSNNDAMAIFGDTGLNLIRILARIARVAGPTLVEPFARWTRQLTRSWEASLLTQEGTDGMRERFIRARETLGQLARIIGNVVEALFGMGQSAIPAGNDLLGALEGVTEKWSEWANSDSGQERMREFFEATKPVTEEIGRLIVNLSQLFIHMGDAGGGPVMGFLQALNWIVEGLDSLLASDLGPVIGKILVLAGAAGALGVVGGMFIKMAAGILRLRPVLFALGGPAGWVMAAVGAFVLLYNKSETFRKRATAAFAELKEVVGPTIDKIVSLVRDDLGPAWESLWPILEPLVGWFAGNFIDIVVDVIGGVVQAIGGLIQAFTGVVQVIDGIVHGDWAQIWAGLKNIFGGAIDWMIGLWKATFGPNLIAGFRALGDGIGKVVDGIGAVFQWLWDLLFGHSIFPDMVKGFQVFVRIVAPIFGPVVGAIGRLGRAAVILWNRHIRPNFTKVRAFIKAAWRFVRPHLEGFINILQDLGRFAKWLWATQIRPNFTRIRNFIKAAWRFIQPHLSDFIDFLGDVGRAAKILYDRFIKPKFQAIRDFLKDTWDFLRDKVFDPLTKLVKTTIPDAFETAKRKVKSTWDKIKGIAAAPVEFIVNTVYTDGIKKVIDAIPGVDNAPSVSFSYAKGTSSVMPGYTPGRDPHNFVSTDGRMGLNLSGGEGIARPEVVRQVGSRAWDAMNYAARRGGDAIGALMNGGKQHGHPGGRQGFSAGGVYRGVAKTLSFFLGGRVPLQAHTSTSQHTSGYDFATWAGDLNGSMDTATPPGAVYAWKPGTVTHTFHGYSDSHGRYGNHVAVDHGGQSSLYAHLSSILTQVGRVVTGGQAIGRVGSTGNSSGPHLHFEVRGGTVGGGTGGSGGGLTPEQLEEQQEAEDEGDSWKDFVGAAKDIIFGIPSKLSDLVNMDGWGPMLRESMGSIGSDFIDWVNDKIPNEIEIPYAPNIHLPDDPIPDKFDRGGTLHHGQTGINLSGKPETVFTNDNIVDLTSDLARIANGLRSQTVDGGGGGGFKSIIENLELTAAPDDVPQVLGDLTHVLRILSLGGVHAKRIAGAPV